MSIEDLPESDLKLKREQRSQLKKALGNVVKGGLPERYKVKEPIITVGDYVTHTLLEQHIIPDLGIVDNKTRRGPYEEKAWDGKEFDKKIDLKNAPERINEESWKIIKRSIEDEEKILIEVHGEEDLLSLPAIIICPLGGIVIYGVPDKGMVINKVTEDLKEKAWEVINNMIEVNEGR